MTSLARTNRWSAMGAPPGRVLDVNFPVGWVTRITPVGSCRSKIWRINFSCFPSVESGMSVPRLAID